ncbi:alpha/beta fold hydrolase [Chryseolinea lacunae]|uniref:Alpha/beta hydrolase n=1 Tax=Chryseolinea lacunae TaxID=2801331 RepID=A0ABS1KTT8_9BACT|nr:alpha/beta hydrolase [Chryseolinea lacunae]MBL0742824.1 alpha/beta hydrolase [Chryseolinea lacunae]
MYKPLFLLSLLALVGLSTPKASAAAEDSLLFYTASDGVKIHYEVKGSGAPVLLVHGFIVDGESWKRTALYNDLVAKGFQVITLDMRGNGKSDKPHTAAAYEKDAEANDIMGLISFLKIKKYDVVGYSRGAIITARLLVLDKRVGRAVLGGMGSDFTNPEWPRRILFYRALSGEPVKELEGMVKRVQESGLDQQALAFLQKEQPSTSVAALGKINRPVLILCGDEDSDNGSAPSLAKMIPKSVYHTVPGDHGGASKTQAFADEVLTFFK